MSEFIKVISGGSEEWVNPALIVHLRLAVDYVNGPDVFAVSCTTSAGQWLQLGYRLSRSEADAIVAKLLKVATPRKDES